MVEVFKTNIQQQKQAEILVGVLSNYFPLTRINFDLEDCDKVLRVEGKIVLPERIMEILNSEGFYCTILE
ncbi:hypothetical protein [Segetibacter koreensis]|uniref:hypothetical protein n=1 Tax=Segetibacter koreensis TaxID=398037 RepID=UPI00035C430A|nr:hypothetical protein [Segetibacter koreensis]